MRILFAGSGEFGLPTLKALRTSGHQIVQVYSQPDRPAGRGRKMTPTPIAQYAIAENLPLIRTQNINNEALPETDLLIVIAFGQKISPHVVDHARFGSINLHASLLPKYRGAAPIHWAILNGEKVTGNSVIRLAQKMDAGAVLGQSHLEIGELETTGQLHDRLAADGPALVLDVMRKMESGQLVEQPQDESQASIAKKLSREMTQLDFLRPAEEIARKIRGLYPWPGCRVKLMRGEEEIARVTLVRARAFGVTESRARVACGLSCITEHGTIACGEGELEIVELQPEGKRSMSLREFRNGKPWEAGMRVESIL